MPEITVYDRKGNQIKMEAVGNGLYAKLKLGDDGETMQTGDVVNLRTALSCGSYFSEEQHIAFLAKQKKKASRK